MQIESEPTVRYDIFMAGDIDQAKQFCREFCFIAGLCVHIEPVDYIYTGGEEAGFKIGLLNYPRFPANNADLHDTALNLAEKLRGRLCQHSYMIVGPDMTEWFSVRDIKDTTGEKK